MYADTRMRARSLRHVVCIKARFASGTGSSCIILSEKHMGRPEKIRLGEILVQQKLLSEDQLKVALEEQKKTGRRLGRVFIEHGFITEEQISKALARQLGADYIDLKHYNLKRDVISTLPETQARRFRAMVLEDRGEAYLVGMADPTDLSAYDDIARQLKRDIEDRKSVV